LPMRNCGPAFRRLPWKTTGNTRFCNSARRGNLRWDITHLSWARGGRLPDRPRRSDWSRGMIHQGVEILGWTAPAKSGECLFHFVDLNGHAMSGLDREKRSSDEARRPGIVDLALRPGPLASSHGQG
jgi:hypothetical protein